jgi:hypothetical protein
MDENSTSGGILVYPAFFKTIVEPGKGYRFTISITNNETSDITVSPEIEKFIQTDNNQNQLQLSDNYDDWFSFQPITVEKLTTKDIFIDLNIPESKNLDDSSYFPAIVLKINEPNQNSNINIGVEYAVPLYLAVSTSYEESVYINKFQTSFINLGTNVSIDITLSNNGNTYISPNAYVEFKAINIINNEDKTRINTVSATMGETTLLPESTLEKSVEWSRNSFGRYEATLHVLSGNTELTNKSVTFWIIPAETITYFAGVLLALVLLLIALTGWKIKNKAKKK